MEDGKPLGPGAPVHEDIRTKGRGAYSHWTADLLYFSASDNGDPRKNGRAYTLVGRFRGLRQTAVVSLTAPSGSYRIRSAGADAVNRRLTLRNPDHRVAVSPRIPRHRGSPDLGSKEAMIGSIIEPGMTPERKSIAIWTFLMDRSYHYWPARGDAELHDPVKFLNVYGYGLCDDAAENFAALCEAAGLRPRVWELNGHVVAESFYDGSWHMFDPDMQCYFRGAGGRVLGVEELAKDPAAITTAPATPSGYPRRGGRQVLRHHVRQRRASPAGGPAGPPHRTRPPARRRGDVRLPPARLVHNVFTPAEPLPPRAANGTLTRRVSFAAGEGESLIRVAWPYVLLGGELVITGGTARDVGIGAEDEGWTMLPTRSDGTARKLDLTPWFIARKDARYDVALRVRGASGEAKRPCYSSSRRAPCRRSGPGRRPSTSRSPRRQGPSRRTGKDWRSPTSGTSLAGRRDDASRARRTARVNPFPAGPPALGEGPDDPASSPDLPRGDSPPRGRADSAPAGTARSCRSASPSIVGAGRADEGASRLPRPCAQPNRRRP